MRENAVVSGVHTQATVGERTHPYRATATLRKKKMTVLPCLASLNYI